MMQNNCFLGGFPGEKCYFMLKIKTMHDSMRSENVFERRARKKTEGQREQRAKGIGTSGQK